MYASRSSPSYRTEWPSFTKRGPSPWRRHFCRVRTLIPSRSAASRSFTSRVMACGYRKTRAARRSLLESHSRTERHRLGEPVEGPSHPGREFIGPDPRLTVTAPKCSPPSADATMIARRVVGSMTGYRWRSLVASEPPSDHAVVRGHSPSTTLRCYALRFRLLTQCLHDRVPHDETVSAQ